MRALVLGTGLLVASLSATLLTAAVDTSAAQVQGTVNASFRTSYDLLVRPPGTQTPLEAEQGLVRNNVESGIFGGITQRQWRTVLDLPGVEVAAPVQYVGFALASVSYEVRLPEAAARAGSMFRVRESTVADAGLSRYPGPVEYIYVARSSKECASLAVRGPVGGSVFASTGPSSGSLDCVSVQSVEPRLVEGTGTSMPLLVAAVDPVEENKLLDLDSALVSGSPLSESLSFERARLGAQVPVIASQESYLDESRVLALERVDIPTGHDPVERLFDPDVAAERLGAFPNRGWRWVHRLPSTPVGQSSVTPQAWHQAFLAEGGEADGYGFFVTFETYVTAGNPSYERLASGRLRPRRVANDPYSVWARQMLNGVEQSNRDVAFRRLSAHDVVVNSINAGAGELEVIGQFDPSQLPGFDPLSRVPLETYFPPQVTAGDPRTAELMGGRPLRPSSNVGGYVATPPALLTTLKAARGLTSPRFFNGGNFEAPISVIRVRVAGVTGADDLSLARIERVATLISERTGLTVDITAGSSPAPQTVELPAGRFGRPQLVLEEGWAKKGVALVILSAVDRKSLVLLGLVLVTTLGYLANAALAAVRARRREIAILLSMGWPRGSVFAAVLGELAVVGVAAGLLGAGLATAVVAVFDLRFPLGRVVFIPLVALVLTVLAGFLPAWRASRGHPIEAVQPPVTGRATSRATRHLAALAWANLRRVPGRSAIAAAGLCLGIASLTALVSINLAFQGTVSGTLLGNFVSVQVRTVDYVAVGLTITLATFSLADVLLLNVRERAAETATLQAVGWSNRHVGALTLLEATIIGGAASIVGVCLGALVGLWVGGPWSTVLLTALITVVVGMLVTAVAALIPSQIAARTPPAQALAMEGA
jgi:ABC-type lipoprotein release transport system permease subunit